MAGDSTCGVCQAPAKHACGGCGSVFYCGKDHQKKHWPTHRQECQPFRVVSSPEAGQFLVAGRNLKAGQVIMKDAPLVISPLATSHVLCLGCTAIIDNENFIKCPKCTWPLCSLECANDSAHIDECPILAKDPSKAAAPKVLGETPRYDIIMILRCLLLQSKNPTGWKTVLSMASHAEERKEDKEGVHQTTIWYLANVLKVDFETDILHQVHGAIVTNSLEIRSEKGTRMRALYPRIRFLNHSCIPNTHLTCISGDMEARTAVPMKSGEPLFICYTGPTMPVWERQVPLRNTYYFECACPRCEDPTESGTYFSSPKCPTCNDQYLLAKKINSDRIWECEKCKLIQNDSTIKEKVDAWLGKLQTNELFEGNSAQQVEAALSETEKAFHSTHYVWMKVAQTALWMMRNNAPIIDILNLRKEIWIRLLSLYETFEPGLTRRRGMSLLETAKALHESSLIEYNNNGTLCTSHMQTAIKYNEEAVQILSLEPPDSMEASLAKKAQANKIEAEKLLARMNLENFRAEGNTGGIMLSKEVCKVCGAVEAPVQCPECNQAFYCSTSHRDAHAEGHKEACQPTVIEQQDRAKGRYLVANKYLKAGDTLFYEEPIALGPRATSRPVCLGCHTLLEDMNSPRCPKCFWPLCSLSCASSELHKAECPILAKDTRKTGQPIDMTNTPRYDCILVLRCLLLRDTKPDAWQRLLSMASHAIHLENDKDPYHMATIRYIKEVLKPDFNVKLIHHSRGAIMANCYEFQTPSKVSLRGMYPKLARINHSCYPNITLSRDCDGAMYVRAAEDIKPGEPLSIAYTGITEPVWERQAYTNKIHYFNCDCKRCSDPDELGLHYSSPRCETCMNQYLHPKTWLWETVWECPMCHVVVQDSLVKMEYIQWMAKFDCNDTFITSFPKGVRNVLEKVEWAFHRNHHVWVMAAQVAIRTLKKNGSRESLIFRKELWQKLLNIYGILEPGLTLRRGTTLFELGATEAALTRLEMKDGYLTNHFYKIYMKEAFDHLQKAIEILDLEPPNSPERKFYRRAVELADLLSLDIKAASVEDKVSKMVIFENSNPIEHLHSQIREN